jgi:Leu/Phe-tRNA-protein transferase
VSQVRNGHTAVLGAVEQPDAQYKELARRIAADLAPG